MEAFWAAIILGMSAGITPGPLMAMVVSEAIRKGARAGVIVAFTPLITDFPIIMFSGWVLRSLPDSELLLSTIATCGAVYLLYLTVESWNAPPVDARPSARVVANLRRAVLVNAFNPHAYMFWLTVGGTMMRHGFSESLGRGLAFPVVFYIALIGCKALIAMVLGRRIATTTSTGLRHLNRLASVAFAIFAVVLLKQALPSIWGYLLPK